MTSDMIPKTSEIINATPMIQEDGELDSKIEEEKIY